MYSSTSTCFYCNRNLHIPKSLGWFVMCNHHTHYMDYMLLSTNLGLLLTLGIPFDTWTYDIWAYICVNTCLHTQRQRQLVLSAISAHSTSCLRVETWWCRHWCIKERVVIYIDGCRPTHMCGTIDTCAAQVLTKRLFQDLIGVYCSWKALTQYYIWLFL